MTTTRVSVREAVTLTPGRLVMIWFAVVLLSVLYCKLSAVIFEGGPVDLHVSLLWAMQTWIPWIVLSGGVWRLAKTEHYAILSMRYVPVLVAGIVVLLLTTDALTYGVLRALELVEERPDLAAHIYMRGPVWAFGAAAVTSGLLLSRRRLQRDGETRPSSIAASTPAPLSPNSDAFISVSTRHGAIDVRIDALEAIESAGNYVQLRRKDGTTYLHRATLKEMLQLTSAMGWMQVHRTALVNPNAIRSRLAGHGLKLASGHTLTIGRSYRRAGFVRCRD